jgi:hypothetical protein
MCIDEPIKSENMRIMFQFYKDLENVFQQWILQSQINKF